LNEGPDVGHALMSATLAAGSRTSPVGCRVRVASGHVVTAATQRDELAPLHFKILA
jgi:hypothetical protein